MKIFSTILYYCLFICIIFFLLRRRQECDFFCMLNTVVQVEEWWEQPAATVVDWVTLDGENVGAWLNRVKKLQSILYERSHDRLEVGH